MDRAPERRPPYCTVAAFEEFLEKMRRTAVPAVVDRRYLQRLQVARNNEWSLLSALKFLGIVDDRGRPTAAYRRLQTAEWRAQLRDLVEAAYAGLIDVGGAGMSREELRSYFSLTSTPAQAKNAARYFAGLVELLDMRHPTPRTGEKGESSGVERQPPFPSPDPAGSRADRLLALKEQVLSSLLPRDHPGWTAAEYQRILEKVLEVLRNLDGTV